MLYYRCRREVTLTLRRKHKKNAISKDNFGFVFGIFIFILFYIFIYSDGYGDTGGEREHVAADDS